MSEDYEDSEILVGRWDCPYGHPGQDGEAMKCSGCGAPRPANVEFYLPSDARKVTDAAGLAAANAGSDLICDSCGSSVAAGQSICPQCADKLNENRRQPVFNVDPKPAPRAFTAPVYDRPLTAQTPLPNNMARYRIGAIAIIIALLCGAWWLFVPHDVTLTVAEQGWQRTISIEAEQTFHEEAWSVPSGGRTTGTYQAVHHHQDRKVGERQVACHPGGHREKTGERHYTCHPGGHREQTGTRSYNCGETNLGNGRFRKDKCYEPTYTTRSCTHQCSEDVFTTRTCTHRCTEDILQPFPVYQTKYRYDIERWVDAPQLQISATDLEPHWPAFQPGPKLREKSRNETRWVHFVDADGTRFTLTDPPPDYWQSLRRGANCTARANRAHVITQTPVCR